MNIWIASMGENSRLNLSTKAIKKIAGDFFGDHHELHVFQFSLNTVTYYSVTINSGPEFQYNQKVENRLFAYSGFPVPRNEDYPDFRSVRKWKEYFDPLPDATKHLMGHYAVLTADGFSFECIVDNLGFQKAVSYTHLTLPTIYSV